MRRLVFLPAARSDLVEIATFLAGQSGSVRVARAFVARLRERCARLAGLPGTLGSSRPELGAGMRAVVEGGYVIVFLYEANRLLIVSVVEGHRDIGSLPGLGEG